MRTKNIFKALALAMLMPAMLLTTACSNQDDVANTSNITNKGYALPVTVNVTRQADGATRASYNESTRKLEFSAGDKLFVSGSATAAGSFAGTLNYVSEGTFSGTIYTQNSYEGTADDLFTAANEVAATLLPNGYESTGFLSIDNNYSPDIAYDDAVSASLNNTFVASETAKANGVEQLSFERASTYSSGFALAPLCAVLNFTISGLEAGSKDVSLWINRGSDLELTGSVTPNASGVATFAIGVPVGANIKDMDDNLTVGTHNFTLPSITVAAGKIYNITRGPIPGALNGKFSVSSTDKVYFSKGNLQATTTNNGTSWTWAFAEHQWDYIGNAEANNAINGNGTVSANGTVDLFGWSTAATYLGIHNSNEDGAYSGDFVDWGNVPGIGEGWYTLTNDEWVYLFKTRSDAANKYGFATVNSVHGIIILPDAFVDPNKNNGSDAFAGSTTKDWGANVYTDANWTLMEANGAVFLPAAGYRGGASVDNVGDYGGYWSSSAPGEDSAHSVLFLSGYFLEDSYDSRYFGSSVRLVRNAN